VLGDAFPAWAPHGNRIAIQRELCSARANNLIAIYVIRADGTHARRVTHRNATCATRHPLEDHAPQWAPNGKRLAFERLDHRREKQAIFTIRLDGSGLRRLTPWRIDAVTAGLVAQRAMDRVSVSGAVGDQRQHPVGSPGRHEASPHHAWRGQAQVAVMLVFSEWQENSSGTGPWIR
jgi:hypothetical protein